MKAASCWERWFVWFRGDCLKVKEFNLFGTRPCRMIKLLITANECFSPENPWDEVAVISSKCWAPGTGFHRPPCECPHPPWEGVDPHQRLNADTLGFVGGGRGRASRGTEARVSREQGAGLAPGCPARSGCSVGFDLIRLHYVSAFPIRGSDRSPRVRFPTPGFPMSPLQGNPMLAGTLGP